MPSSSIVSRIALGTLLLCCCGSIAMCMLFVASFFVRIPDLHQHIQQQLQQQLQRATTGPVVEINQHGDTGMFHHSHNHAQRSVIQRLAMLRRAHAPEHGVDKSTVETVFPRWLGPNRAYNADAVLGDMALALSYLATDEQEEI